MFGVGMFFKLVEEIHTILLLSSSYKKPALEKTGQKRKVIAKLSLCIEIC